MDKLTINIVRENGVVVVHTKFNEEPVIQSTHKIHRAQTLYGIAPALVSEALEVVRRVRKQSNHESHSNTERTVSPF